MSTSERIAKFLTQFNGREFRNGKKIIMTSAVGAAKGTVPEGLSYVIQGTKPDVVGITANVSGNGPVRTVTLDLVNVTIDAIAATANEAVGVLLYTLPAGANIIESAHMNIALTNTDGDVDADTPEVGVGTVIATGAVAVLGGTATFENILTGTAATDVTGTATVLTESKTDIVVASAGAHTIHLNIADGWADADAGIIANGKIIVKYTQFA